MIRPAIAVPIADFESAKAWIRGISDAGLMFHFEDSAETIFDIRTMERTFSDDEAPIVRERVAALYGFDWGEFDCPIGYALAIEGQDAEA